MRKITRKGAVEMKKITIVMGVVLLLVGLWPIIGRAEVTVYPAEADSQIEVSGKVFEPEVTVGAATFDDRPFAMRVAGGPVSNAHLEFTLCKKLEEPQQREFVTKIYLKTDSEGNYRGKFFRLDSQANYTIEGEVVRATKFTRWTEESATPGNSYTHNFISSGHGYNKGRK